MMLLLLMLLLPPLLLLLLMDVKCDTYHVGANRLRLVCFAPIHIRPTRHARSIDHMARLQ
jgi:hypothetical protein